MTFKRSILGLALAAALPAAAWAEETRPVVGVVVMHGKSLASGKTGRGGRGGGAGGPAMSYLENTLRSHGYLVEAPEMPWSPHRHYDVSYAEMLGEVDAAIARLKEKGAAEIFVAGHSFGAASAMGYCRAHPGSVKGIAALSPGHQPESNRMRELFADDVEKAHQMVAAGQGDETASFDEMNQGEPMAVSTTARHYLDWFDPEGPANLHANTAGCSGVPVFWVISTDEKGKPVDRPMFDTIPPNPGSRFLVVPGEHADTAEGAATRVVEWIEQTR